MMNEMNNQEMNYMNNMNNENGSNNGSQNKEQKPNKEKKKAGIFRYLVVALLCGAMAGGAFEGGQYAAQQLTTTKTASTNKVESNTTAKLTSTSGVSSEADVSSVVENVMPSIVAVNVTTTQTYNYWGQTYQQEASGSGSGIIIGENDNEIFVVTNNHVIEGDDTKVSVTFQDEKAVDATVKGADSTSDLAVLTIKKSDIDSSTLETIRIATLGDSDETKVGEMVIAIGNALGYGQSVTVGYVSAKDREVTFEDASMKLLQTDAAINPGNSGGALLNAAGEVIGINSSKYADESVEGMGFAIPISNALPIIQELMNREQLAVSEQGYLGIRGQDVTEEVAEAYNMPEGIYIGEVSEGSPAEEAGLVAGQIITKVNGRAVTSLEALQSVLTYTKAGTTVTVTVQELSDGSYKEKNIEVKLGSKSSSGQSSASSEDRDKNNSNNNNSNNNGGMFGGNSQQNDNQGGMFGN